ncbi:MAG: gspI [Burkholderiales bacterium]|jgi:general secretion pathway protein I|nr:gspI [Burkholderiales bacterium]MCE3267868.1 gspI [Burkholderiales bacterium]
MDQTKRSRVQSSIYLNNGFTLIECLVALFIIAIVLASTSRAIGLSISDVHDSFARQTATWVADNEANQYIFDGVYPDAGKTTKNVTMGGTDFIVEINVTTTPNPYFRRMDIAVSQKLKPNKPIYKTSSFISQF